MNLTLRVNAAPSGVPGAELLPGQAEWFVHTAVANGLQALGIGGRAAVGDQAERLMASQPGAQVHHLFVVLAVPARLLLIHELLPNRNGCTDCFTVAFENKRDVVR